MGERILALKQKLIETLKARFGTLPEARDIKEQAQAKFDLSSIDYVSEGFAITIIICINTIKRARCPFKITNLDLASNKLKVQADITRVSINLLIKMLDTLV